jgi:ADP-ribose pyrophosphatase YjhB (NUDIX family)
MITCTFEKGHTANLRHAVVHAIAERDGSILLAKRAPDLTEGGKWSLPSGFVDRDETLETSVIRELLEETGWRGEMLHLFRIITNPKRRNDERQNIAFIYLIKPLVKAGEPDSESTDMTWAPIATFKRDYPADSLAFDHGETISHYFLYREKPFPLPLLG